jgi:hypothetical protein
MDQLTSKSPEGQQDKNSRYVGPDYWKKSKNKWSRYIPVLVAAIILAGLYWVYMHPKTAPPPEKVTAVQAKPISPGIPTTNYSSSNFALSFDYPKGWAVTDSGNGVLSVRSRVMQLKSATGKNVEGQVIMTIANKGQNLSVFDKGDATAVMDSKKISYTKPTPSQRANTYISFLQYAATTQAGALDGVYITGDFGYQKGQNIPKTDIANIDPLVTVTFVECATSDCPAGTTKALSISSASWNDSDFSAPVLKMLQSLAFS